MSDTVTGSVTVTTPAGQTTTVAEGTATIGGAVAEVVTSPASLATLHDAQKVVSAVELHKSGIIAEIEKLGHSSELATAMSKFEEGITWIKAHFDNNTKTKVTV